MIVLDASAAIDLLLDVEGAGAAILERLEADEGALNAPHLLDLEVAQVLRRYVHEGTLAETRARATLEDLADLPLRRHAHDVLLPRVWALRDDATAYDAVYLALAEALGAVLLTRDAALSAVPGVEAEVEVL